MPPKKQNAPSSSRPKEDKVIPPKSLALINWWRGYRPLGWKMLANVIFPWNLCDSDSLYLEKQVCKSESRSRKVAVSSSNGWQIKGTTRQGEGKVSSYLRDFVDGQWLYLCSRALREKEKLEEEKRKKEEAALLGPVQTQKVPFGVDPKTVLCAFYKAGNCDKGTKCKFSHDLNVGRKVEKKNLYEDSREEKMKGALFNLQFVSTNAYCYGCVIDTMDTWDEEKLRQVVLSKAGNPRTTTDVSHFLLSYFPLHELSTDCLQTFHSSYRDIKVCNALFFCDCGR
jgi:hypothetical protein